MFRSFLMIFTLYDNDDNYFLQVLSTKIDGKYDRKWPIYDMDDNFSLMIFTLHGIFRRQ